MPPRSLLRTCSLQLMEWTQGIRPSRLREGDLQDPQQGSCVSPEVVVYWPNLQDRISVNLDPTHERLPELPGHCHHHFLSLLGVDGRARVVVLPHIHTLSHTGTLTHSNSHTHAITHTSTHTYTHVHTCSHIYTQTHSNSHTCIHTLTHILTDTHSNSQTHACTHSHIHSRTHIHVHTCSHTLTHILTHTQIHKHVHTHTHTYTSMYTHMFTCIHSHTYTHTHTQTHHPSTGSGRCQRQHPLPPTGEGLRRQMMPQGPLNLDSPASRVMLPPLPG